MKNEYVGQRPKHMNDHEWKQEIKRRQAHNRRQRELKRKRLAKEKSDKAAMAKAKRQKDLLKRDAVGRADVVYVVGWQESGPCKIGITDNLDKRLKQLQTGCPYKLVAFQTFPLFNKELTKKLESMAHERLGAFRMQGEWFSLDSKSCIDSVSTLANLL